MSTANKIMLVNNRVERAKSYLLSQFKDKPNINALVDALVSELQELENVINDLQTVRTLDGAYGWWLDQIGNDLDVSRGNYGDDDYKTAIKIAMAKKTASASVDDILRIVSLITSDSQAQLNNDSHYLLELYSYFFCVSESYDGLNSLASLFPLNTRVRFVKHDVLPFTLGASGSGFAGTLCDLVLSKNGIVDDPRFVSVPTQDIPPAISSAPSIVSNPYIYGDSVVGATLSLVIGTYDGDEPLVYNVKWLLDGYDIVGATGMTYNVISGDAGKNISVVVDVSNAYGQVFAYSNAIAISSTIPTPLILNENLGLEDFYTTQNFAGTNSAKFRFNSDGSIDYRKNSTTVKSDKYLSTIAVGAGNDFNLIYTVIEGTPLTGLNPNALHVLSSSIEVGLSVTSVYDEVKTGVYQFTISSISNPSVTDTRIVYLGTEVTGTA